MTLRISQIVRELTTLREKSASGTYVVRTEGGEQAHVSIDRGEIIAVKFDGRNYPPKRLLETLSGMRATATNFIDTAGHLESRQSLGRQHDLDVADGAARRLICDQLAAVLGPIAVHICDERNLPKQSFEALLILVSQEIDDPERAKAFCAEVRRKHYGSGRAEADSIKNRRLQMLPLAVEDDERASSMIRVVAAGQHESSKPAQQRKDFQRVDAEALRVIRQRLVDILGPLAEVVCAEKAAPNQTVENLLSLVSQEIDDPGRARSFREAVRRELAMGKGW